ncbi:MAG: hypothetical protein NT150_01420 [Bacteroidetes bacterium]|nr:hypothetical protein [Bacteroidota bacterium]
MQAIFPSLAIGGILVAFSMKWINPIYSVALYLLILFVFFRKRRSKIYFLSFYNDCIIKEFRFVKTEEKILYSEIEKVVDVRLRKNHNIAIFLKDKQTLHVYTHEEILKILNNAAKEYGFKMTIKY